MDKLNWLILKLSVEGGNTVAMPPRPDYVGGGGRNSPFNALHIFHYKKNEQVHFVANKMTGNLVAILN